MTLTDPPPAAPNDVSLAANVESKPPVHAWLNPPVNGSDVWCGSRDRLKDITVVNETVTCPECRRLLDEYWRPR
jgi:hypothetical protein